VRNTKLKDILSKRKKGAPKPISKPTAEDYTSQVRVSGSRPKKAVIESPSGRYEIKIKPGDTGTDFAFKGNRYIFDGNAVKTKTPDFLLAGKTWLLYCGAMFCMFGLAVPQMFIFGVFNLFAAFALRSAEHTFKETYSLYYEGQPKPVKTDTSPAHLLPGIVRDKSGRIVDVKFYDSITFDAAVIPHIAKDLTSGGPKITWDQMKWIIVAVVVVVVIYGVAKYAGVIGG
jgi:hypothetical protein